MSEDVSGFVIKALVAGLVIVVLYFVTSPYQNCVRNLEDSFEENIRRGNTPDVPLLEIQARAACSSEHSW